MGGSEDESKVRGNSHQDESLTWALATAERWPETACRRRVRVCAHICVFHTHTQTYVPTHNTHTRMCLERYSQL